MGRLGSIGRLIRSFVRLDATRRALVIEAAACLLGARLTLVFVPFSRIARSLGTFVSPTDGRAVDALITGPDEHRRLARQIGWAVSRAAIHVPFSAACLQQAMAARIMLGRRGVKSILHFGAMTSDATFAAHAWLDAAGVAVTGYPVATETVEIACFI